MSRSSCPSNRPRAGPHWLLRVEKRGANTRWVAAEIARLAGVPAGDVGYAGLKDRHAVAVQWFSVPKLATTAEFWNGVRTSEFKVLETFAPIHASCGAARCRATGFASACAMPCGRVSNWTRSSRLCAVHGVPNYFGPQRFGRGGYNLDRVAAWVQSGAAPRGRAERSFALSAARSLLFNAVLARRVEAGDWSQLAPGDLAMLDGSGSHFSVSAVDEELRRRSREFDIHPSGPLWGRGLPASQGQACCTNWPWRSELAPVAELLAAQGLSQERRALRCAVRELAVERDRRMHGAGDLTLSFFAGARAIRHRGAARNMRVRGHAGTRRRRRLIHGAEATLRKNSPR